MPKTVAIVQSNYIPWKGYFDLIRAADEFIFFDDVQYTRRDWRNRNRIKTKEGLLWLSIPVESKGRYHAAIKDMVISDRSWGRRHWKTLAASYARTPHFKEYEGLFAPLFLEAEDVFLVDVNYKLISAVCKVLGIETRFSHSSLFDPVDGRSERIVALCRQTGATRYLSGPSARTYLDASAFASAGIELAFADYSSYPEYPQVHPPFVHDVSVLDLLFNAGGSATRFMLSF
jgi:hypothetical protein